VDNSRAWVGAAADRRSRSQSVGGHQPAEQPPVSGAAASRQSSCRWVERPPARGTAANGGAAEQLQVSGAATRRRNSRQWTGRQSSHQQAEPPPACGTDVSRWATAGRQSELPVGGAAAQATEQPPMGQSAKQSPAGGAAASRRNRRQWAGRPSRAGEWSGRQWMGQVSGWGKSPVGRRRGELGQAADYRVR
jgi:hypothetical protein